MAMEPSQRPSQPLPPPPEYSETTPLLADAEGVPASEQAPTHGARRAQWVLILVCVVIVAIDFGSYLSIAPQIEIFESIICQRLHGGEAIAGNGNPPICKS